MSSVSLLVKKHWQLMTFVICLLLFIWLVGQFIGVVLPFLVGLIIAYLLLPLVRWLERHLPGGKKHAGLKRVLIIIGIYFVGLLMMAGVMFYMFTVVSSSTALLWQNLPQLVSGIVTWLENLMATIRLDVPASLLQQYDQAINDGGVMLANTLRSGLGLGFSMVTASASLILGFFSLPMILFFMLKDWDNLRDGIFGSMPPWAREYAKNVFRILDRVMGRYIRAQIIISLSVGVLVFVLLTVLRIPFAPALAEWASLMELIPLFGIWLSIGAGVLIALATEPAKVMWVAAGYVIIWLTENNLLVPRIQGNAMRLNPLFIVLISIIGARLAGLIGFVIAVPVAATVIELLKYFRHSVREKEAE